jgi:uncharacterized membrane protein
LTRRAWVIPSIYSSVAIVAGQVLPRIEHRIVPELVAGMSVPAAIAIYSSIAAGMLSLTGSVFSLVFVMAQFSATAYSPRLVRWVARTPLISHALGVFTATFLYAIGALAWIGRGESDTVPFISAMVIVALLIASVCVFIGLIERIALISVNHMLTFTGDQGRGVIDTIYPAPINGDDRPPSDYLSGRALTQRLQYRGRPASIQSIDIKALVALAASADALIEFVPAIGETVAESGPLVNVWGGRHPIDERRIRAALVIGDERTFEQDPKYALRLLVDIAIRALSPAINDPTTAVQALDQISDLLLRLARRKLEIGAHTDAHGVPRLIIPYPSWDDFLRLGFDEIRAYGANSIQIARRMGAVIADLLPLVPERRRSALISWQSRLERTIARTFPDREDQLEASIEDRQGLGVSRRRTAA